MNKKKITNSVKEIADNALAAGAYSNYNEDTPGNPKGKINWNRLAGQVLGSLALIYEIVKLFK